MWALLLAREDPLNGLALDPTADLPVKLTAGADRIHVEGLTGRAAVSARGSRREAAMPERCRQQPARLAEQTAVLIEGLCWCCDILSEAVTVPSAHRWRLRAKPQPRGASGPLARWRLTARTRNEKQPQNIQRCRALRRHRLAIVAQRSSRHVDSSLPIAEVLTVTGDKVSIRSHVRVILEQTQAPLVAPRSS
jgi:hypothetical protein